MSWERFKVMVKEGDKKALEFDAYEQDYAALGRARELRDGEPTWHVWVTDGEGGPVILDPSVDESVCSPAES
jgi:hypothetical protein